MNKLAIIVFLVACGRQKAPEAIDPNRPVAIAVDELPTEIPEYPAIITTKETKLASSENTAPVKKIYARAGQIVKKGDILLDLDDVELKGAVAKLQANIASNRSEAAAGWADANNQSRKASMQRRLFNGGAGTMEAVRDATSGADSAGARGEAANHRAQSAAEELKETERLIERCHIRAEIDGEVVFINATEGKTVQKGQAVARVSDTSDLRVKFLVPLSKYRELKIGQTVQVFMPNQAADRVILAKVIDFSRAAENHVDAAVVEADLDDNKLQRDEVSASGQGRVRFVTEGGKS